MQYLETLYYEKLFDKGHIRTVEKTQEICSDTGMHKSVHVPLVYYINSGCVLECRDTATYISHCGTSICTLMVTI